MRDTPASCPPGGAHAATTAGAAQRCFGFTKAADNALGAYTVCAGRRHSALRLASLVFNLERCYSSCLAWRRRRADDRHQCRGAARGAARADEALQVGNLSIDAGFARLGILARWASDVAVGECTCGVFE